MRASGSSSAFTRSSPRHPAVSASPDSSASPLALQGASCNNRLPTCSTVALRWGPMSRPTPQSVSDREAPPASLQAALTIIGRTPAVLRGLVGGLDAAVLEAAPGSTEDSPWGPRRVAEHLLDVEDIGFMD